MVKCSYPEYWKNQSLDDIKYINDEGIECVEDWLPIEHYEGCYSVSNLGRIKSIGRKVWNQKTYLNIPEKIKPSFDDGKGYRRIELSKQGRRRKIFVHRLVAQSFIPNPENKPDPNHKDGNRSDNRHYKLEWHTESENRRHAINVLGSGTGRPWKGCKKEDHPMFGRKGKLAPSSKPVLCNEKNKKFESIKEASIKLGIPETVMKCLLTGKTKKSKYGLTFKFI